MSTSTETDELQVWIEQDLCTGDGLCVQYAPEVFEFDIDGLANAFLPEVLLDLERALSRLRQLSTLTERQN